MRRSDFSPTTVIAALLTLILAASPAAASCGDGVVDAGETCDDSNTVAGDGCSDTCQFEGCPYTGTWIALVGQIQFIGQVVEDASGNLTGVSYPVGEPDDPSTGTGTRTGATITSLDEKTGFTNVGTMVSCDEIHFTIVELPGFTYVSHRVRSTYCGDGILQPADGEVCDDGNFAGGDTCGIDCLPPPPPVCGNGDVESGEQCDDGNTAAGDGCSNDCLPNTCGNGAVESGEICDDGNTAPGDGCSALCQFEGCSYTGTWTTTIGTTVYVGAATEDALGNIAGASYVVGDPRTANVAAGSRSGATITFTYSGQPFTHVGTMLSCDLARFRIVELGNFQYDAIRVPIATYCGDGIVQSADGEVCDDGNTTGGDGCSAVCQFEGCALTGAWQSVLFGTTYVGHVREDEGGALAGTTLVAGSPATAIPITSGTRSGSSVTVQYAGQAVAQVGTMETCDLVHYQIPGTTLAYDAVRVRSSYCGDGIVQGASGEVCDDGNFVNGDACSVECSPASGCGNGLLDAGETCDDGNANPNDACVPGCVTNVCGDGIVESGVERCDDGNTVSGDGCVADCSALETDAKSGNVGAFFLTVSTDPAGVGATAGDPVEASVTAPPGTTAGSISIVEAPAPPDAPPGFAIMGTAIQIEATGITPAPTAATPMRVVFAIDASQIVAGQDETTIVIQKNGTPVGSCTGASTIATPDPCVAKRERLADGDVRITVNTTTFSTWSSLGSVCGAAPALGCKASLPGKSSLTLTENGAKDVLRWTWKGLDEVPAGLFGAPATDGEQTICVYDADGVQLAATAPAGGTCGNNPCWKSLPKGKGFRYASKDRTPQGIGTLVLGAGAAGKAKIVASAGGSALTAPAGPLTLPVVVQLRSAQGGCFEARFGTASSNAGGKFKAKSD